MTQEHAIAFGPFRLETPPGRLWQGDHLIPLRPHCLAMWRYLAAHPGRLVPKPRCSSPCVRARISPRTCCGYVYGRFGSLGRCGGGAAEL
jgi:hypothetical protein